MNFGLTPIVALIAGVVVWVVQRATQPVRALSDQLLSRVGRASPLAPYRVRAGTAHLDFAGVNARRLLGWVPRIGVRRGLAQESR